MEVFARYWLCVPLRAPDWLHGLLANEVSDVVGIDINDTTRETLKSEGYDARLGDAHDFDLHRSSMSSSLVS